MESFTFVKVEDNDSILLSQFLACRVCLETESKLFDLHLYGLADIFGVLTGTQVSRTDGLPQHICSVCYVQLRKSSAFRAKCRQVHVLLQDARVRQPLMTTSHLRTLDRSQFKQQFSFTNALIISIPIETDTNKPDENITDIKLNFQQAFIDQIEEIDYNENTPIIKNEPSLYYESIESNDQFDADKTLDYPVSSQNILDDEASETVESIDEAKDIIMNDSYNEINHEVLEDLNTKDVNAELESATKKKTPLKKKKKQKIKVRDTKRRFNVKLVEDFAEFNKMYNCETVFKTKEQQLKEVEERKESAAFKKSRFQCMTCYKGFMNNVAYEKHMVMHDKVSGEHACDVCQSRFQSRKRMLLHARQHKYRFACKSCDHVSRESYIARAHFKWHGGFKYECEVCRKQFNAVSTRINHKRSYHAPVTCVLCNATVSGTKALEEHCEKVHSAAKFPCVTCKTKIESQEAFDRHLNPDNICIRYFPCTKCGENFSNEQQLYKHTESSHGDTLFKCEVCPAVFASGIRLAAHWTQRHSKITYMCEVCAKTFSCAGQLRRHQRLHTGEKPHPCHMCPKRFRLKVHLDTHINMHTGERPYKCDHCEASYKSSANRHKHFVTVHKKVRPHKCHLCDKAYTTPSDVKKHIRSFHMKKPLSSD